MKTATKAKTKLQIIDETVRFYSKNQRCKGESGYCVYWKGPKSQCAVGRALRHPKKYKDVKGDFLEFLDETGENNQNIFKPEYRGHEAEFWNSLQYIHDEDCMWEDAKLVSKLSKYGKREVEKLKARYKSTSRPNPELKQLLC